MIIMRLVTFDELIQVPVFLLPLEEPAVERHQNVESVTKQGATVVITFYIVESTNNQITTKPGGHQLSILIIVNAVSANTIINIESIVIIKYYYKHCHLLQLGYIIVKGKVTKKSKSWKFFLISLT